MHHKFAAIRTFAALCAMLAAFVPAAAAQDAPLRKSDIVRMLSGDTYSTAEVATIVRANCLSFTPTQRDLADFQNLGGDEDVLGAVRECAAAGRTGEPQAGDGAPADGAGGGAQPAPATPRFEVEPVSTIVTAPVDSSALVTVLVRRAGQPYGGLEVVLRGSGAISGGSGTDRVGTSGADGRATILVPTGTRVARYPLTIAAPGATLSGSTSLTLETTPAAPTVLASPASPVVHRGGALDLDIAVEDEFGNEVPGLDIAVAGVPDGSVIARGRTGGDGRIRMTLPSDDLRGVRRLVVSSEDGTIDELVLRSDVQAVTMQFVGGTSQTGAPGERLDEPVTVEIYDIAGDPAPDVEVRFSARNGSLDADTLRTGPDGRASVRVTAGTDASRPVEIRARAGSAETVASLPILSPGGVVAEAIAAGQRRLDAGDAPGAVTSYRRAVDLQPGNANAWAGLARALTAAGRTEDARMAWEEVLDIDPDNQEAEAALATPGLSRNVFGADVWGGSTPDTDREAGLRYAEVRIDPAVGWVRLRGVYDDALNLRHPWLKRGRDDLRALSGGADLRWGPSRRLTTTLELGRREQPISDLTQNTYLLAQGVRLPGGGNLRFGGWVGRWFDRDDYVVFGEGRFPASRYVTIVPSLSYADEAGSNVLTDEGLTATGRAPETEFRGGLKLLVESPDGWGFEPGLAVGSVSSDLSSEFEGSLLDATAAVWVRLGQVRLQGFTRYQSPPGTSSFWTFALGLGLDVQAR